MTQTNLRRTPPRPRTDPMKLEGCVFCTPEQLPEKREVLYASDGTACWVFTPLNPVTPGHTLVVPVAHAPSAATDPALTGAVMEVAARIAGRHVSANIITSIGTAATQTVLHLHLHVVPRRAGDNLPLPWTPQQERRPSPGRTW